MTHPRFLPCLILTLCGTGGLSTLSALAAPGEDLVILSKPVEHLSLPGPLAPKSGNLLGAFDMPAWMRARVTRYEAKAFSANADDGGMFTDSDTVNTANAIGLRKTCVQEVGSNANNANNTFNRYGPSNQQQIVVLRGDLVNICK
ncbi:MAG: hypothetical protein RIS90_2551 [Pseudomonadota bacterium]|jgi:hypothetical protein